MRTQPPAGILQILTIGGLYLYLCPHTCVVSKGHTEWWCQHNVTRVVSTHCDTRVDVDASPCFRMPTSTSYRYRLRVAVPSLRKYSYVTSIHDVTQVMSTQRDTRVNMDASPYFTMHTAYIERLRGAVPIFVPTIVVLLVQRLIR